LDLTNTKKRVLLVTLGCPKNEVDTDVLGGILKTNGLHLVNNSDEADIILINTCGFIESAKQESIDTILEAVELKKEKKDLKVYVWGCLTERYKHEIRNQIPEVDGFWGVEPFREISKFFLGSQFIYNPHNWQTRMISNYRHTAYIKIADGCNHNCSFCIIPAIKGDFKSRDLTDIIAEAHMLSEKGVKELHLVAQDTTAYGVDLLYEADLSRLLKELKNIEGLEWIRILYAYPDSVTDKLIQIIADEPKVCSYLDIPLQHISNRILKSMGRNPDTKNIRTLLDKLRNRIPDLTLRTSFIVGFPGETENDFQELINFIEEMRFNRVGCFVFSPEKGTKAFNYSNQVDEKEAVSRYNRLMDVQYEISNELNNSYIDKIIQVIIDGYDEDNGMYYGRSEGDGLEIDQTVWVRGGVDIGEFYNVKIDHSSAYDLEGYRI